MKMFILGFVVAWFACALLAYISERIGKGGIMIFNGFAATALTLPLLPFALVARGVYEVYKRLFNRSAS